MFGGTTTGHTMAAFRDKEMIGRHNKWICDNIKKDNLSEPDKEFLKDLGERLAIGEESKKGDDRTMQRIHKEHRSSCSQLCVLSKGTWAIDVSVMSVSGKTLKKGRFWFKINDEQVSLLRILNAKIPIDISPTQPKE